MVGVDEDAGLGCGHGGLELGIVGEEGLDTTVRTMGAEDVGLFMVDIPGMYFFVGAQDMTQDAYYAHHHPRFSVDEDALPLAAGLLATAVAEYVLPE